jgi:hypothetical protein
MSAPSATDINSKLFEAISTLNMCVDYTDLVTFESEWLNLFFFPMNAGR